MTMLHSGGKFSGKAYETSGGLHGVGVSVVNALSSALEVKVARDGFEWRQTFSRGKPTSKLEQLGPSKKRGTSVRFSRTEQIFGEGGVQAGQALPHGPLKGLSVPRRGDPLDVRARAHPGPDAGGGQLPLPRWPRRLPRRTHGGPRDRHRSLRRPDRAPKQWGRPGRWNGPSPGRRPGSARRTASCPPTATPCRPPRAARTRPACARR